MKTKILVGFYLLIALVACNKETNVNKPVVQVPNYYPLSTGSYWVYNTYKIDSLKNEELISENDTTTIIGDTNLNGYQYKIFYGKEYGFSNSKTEKFLRDSLGYIVDESGKILFSQTNFTDTLYSQAINEVDTLFYRYSMMQTVLNEINIPAGLFDSVLNYNQKFIYWMEPNKLTFNMNNLYGPNVGKLLGQNSYAGLYLDEKSYYEERLIKYFIAE